MITCERIHDFSYGHRVVGHEGKCRYLHGHNGRITFTAAARQLDGVGRVVDFSVLKSSICQWLEDNWDHKFLMWNKDPLRRIFDDRQNFSQELSDSLVVLPFNPTAENLGDHLLNVIGPQMFVGTGVKLVKIVFEETRKCSTTIDDVYETNLGHLAKKHRPF